MSCEECLPLLEEHLDGALDAAAAARAAAHLAACAGCAEARERLAREGDFYLSHAPEVAPSPDFWEGVGARIAADGSTRVARSRRGLGGLLADTLGLVAAPRFSPALTAAAVLVAVALTAGLMKYANRESARHERAATAPSDAVRGANEAGAGRIAPPTPKGNGEDDAKASDELTNEAGLERKPAVVKRMERATATTSERRREREKVARRIQTSDQLVREAEQKYVAAIALLSRDARRTHTRLEPDAAARFRSTLAEIDRAIDETRRAARRNPRDPSAAQYMLAAYAKKVDLLREMTNY